MTHQWRWAYPLVPTLRVGTRGEQAAVLARDLGYPPLALEQAGAYMVETRASFDRYLAWWH